MPRSNTLRFPRFIVRTIVIALALANNATADDKTNATTNDKVFKRFERLATLTPGIAKLNIPDRVKCSDTLGAYTYKALECKLEKGLFWTSNTYSATAFLSSKDRIFLIKTTVPKELDEGKVVDFALKVARSSALQEVGCPTFLKAIKFDGVRCWPIAPSREATSSDADSPAWPGMSGAAFAYVRAGTTSEGWKVWELGIADPKILAEDDGLVVSVEKAPKKDPASASQRLTTESTSSAPESSKTPEPEIALAVAAEKCFSRVAMPDLVPFTIRLKVDLKEDGSVASPPVALDKAADESPFVRATRDSAVRAVMMCGPYTFGSAPRAKWKQLTVSLNSHADTIPSDVQKTNPQKLAKPSARGSGLSVVVPAKKFDIRGWRLGTDSPGAVKKLKATCAFGFENHPDYNTFWFDTVMHGRIAVPALPGHDREDYYPLLVSCMRSAGLEQEDRSFAYTPAIAGGRMFRARVSWPRTPSQTCGEIRTAMLDAFGVSEANRVNSMEDGLDIFLLGFDKAIGADAALGFRCGGTVTVTIESGSLLQRDLQAASRKWQQEAAKAPKTKF